MWIENSLKIERILFPSLTIDEKCIFIDAGVEVGEGRVAAEVSEQISNGTVTATGMASSVAEMSDVEVFERIGAGDPD